MPQGQQSPITVKEFADKWYEKAADNNPSHAAYHEDLDDIYAKNPNGISDRQLWDEVTKGKHGDSFLKAFRLVPETAPTPAPGGVTMGAYHPSVLERIAAPLREGAFGRAFHVSSETVPSLEQDPSNPVLRMESAAPDVGPGAVRGALQFASGLTTPENLLLMAGTGGLGSLEGQLGKGLVSRLVSAGFSAKMLRDAYQQIPALREAWDKQDWPTVRQTLTQMTLGVGMAGMAGRHAAKGRAVPTEARTAPPPEPAAAIPETAPAPSEAAAPPTPPQPPSSPPSTLEPAKPPKVVSDVGEEFRKEAAAGSKKLADAKRIQLIAASMDQTLSDADANRILGQLKKHGFINSSREILPAATAATAATAAPPAAPALSVSEHNARAAQTRAAGLPSKVVRPTPQVVPTAAPSQVPTVDLATPPTPAGTPALRVMPPPAQVPTVDVGPPTPQSIGQATVPQVRQQAMVAQNTAPPPTVTADQLAAAEVMKHEPAGAPPAAPTEPVSAGRTDPLAAESVTPAGPLTAEQRAAKIQNIKNWATNLGKGTEGTQYYDWRRPTEPGEQPPSEIFRDLYDLGRDAFDRAGNTFQGWRDEMVNTFGPWVEAHLMPIWQQVTQARPIGAALTPPETAPPAAAALPPSQPPPLRWDALHAGKGPATPAPPDIPPPLGAASWEQWLQSVRSSGMLPEEIERRANAAMEPRIQGPLQHPLPIPISELEYHGAPTAIQNPSGKLPPMPPGVQPPEAPPSFSLMGRATPVSLSAQFHEALKEAGLENPSEEDLPDDPTVQRIKAAGFVGKERVFQRVNTKSGPDYVLNQTVLPILPSGQQASESWSKPVQDGTIEIHRNGTSGEFVATKRYSDGTKQTSHGTGDKALLDYLGNVEQRELPLRQSQRISRSAAGAPPFDTSRIATATPPGAPTAAQTSDAIVEAVRNLERSTRGAPTTAELQRIILNATMRSQAEQAMPPEERSPIPERLAEGVTAITGGQPLDTNAITRIISEAVARRRVAEGLPAPAKSPAPLPANLPIVDTGAKPVQRRTKVPEESQFTVADKGEGAWIVTPKDGGETNIFIRKAQGSRFLQVYIGNKLMRKTSTLTAAKLEAVKLAEQQLAAGEAIKRPRGRPATVQPPPVVVTPVAATGSKIQIPPQ